MPDSPHSLLTGDDLHEPKGVEDADANELYVANGAGGGVWQKITSSSINDSSITPWSTGLVHARLNDSATHTSLSKVTFTALLINDVAGASLSSGAFVLPAGTYWFEGFATAMTPIPSSASSISMTLYNATDASNVLALTGPAGTISSGGAGYVATLPVRTRFTIAAQKTIEVQILATGATSFLVDALFVKVA